VNGRKKSAKHERCIRDVKSRGGVANPFAVCAHVNPRRKRAAPRASLKQQRAGIMRQLANAKDLLSRPAERMPFGGTTHQLAAREVKDARERIAMLRARERRGNPKRRRQMSARRRRARAPYFVIRAARRGTHVWYQGKEKFADRATAKHFSSAADARSMAYLLKRAYEALKGWSVRVMAG
jgi:hypothetical protein